ncbi:Hypothetical predicted protein [Octopus vulgaris]|uniref:Uncharacterized protein n=1 Tax=Octopus vulgaris TaxID=6645 RepID=A0AA36BZM9_OCTVU|nr:Hypothetical predicted protein [Octopus vulgaris]
MKGSKIWLSDDVERKLPNISAKELMIHFPASYLVECDFSAVEGLLLVKRSRLEITKRGALWLKLKKLSPRIKEICHIHQAQGTQ